MFHPNLPIRTNELYQHSPYVSVHIILDHKIFFQQRIAFLFGAAKLAEVLASPKPFIFPSTDYNLTFDVFIFILL